MPRSGIRKREMGALLYVPPFCYTFAAGGDMIVPLR